MESFGALRANTQCSGYLARTLQSPPSSAGCGKRQLFHDQDKPLESKRTGDDKENHGQE